MSTVIAMQLDTQNRFTELLEQHGGIVRKVAGTYCWHPDDRDELSQEIHMRLWRAFPNYDDTRPFATWMYRVALNASISWVRRNSLRLRHMTALDEDAHLSSEARGDPDEDGRITFLRRFIDSLDPVNRALMLLYMEEQSYADIAAVLGISKSNVATKINRLKKRVREQSARTTNKGDNHGTR